MEDTQHQHLTGDIGEEDAVAESKKLLDSCVKFSLAISLWREPDATKSEMWKSNVRKQFLHRANFK